MTNLVHDTLYRRSRASVMRAVHQIDDLMARAGGGPVRVLFEAASPMSFAVFRPVFDRLRRDPRLEFWFTGCDQSWNAQSIFAASGLSERAVTPADVRWKKF